MRSWRLNLESFNTVFDLADKHGPSILCFEDCHVLWSDKEKNSKVKEDFLSHLQQYQGSTKDGDVWSNILAVVVVSSSPWLFDPELKSKTFKQIHLDLPSKETRRDLIEFHLRDTSFELTDEELNELAESTAGRALVTG